MKRFDNLPLKQQLQEYKNLLRTFREHLKKYKQVEGKTLGETNRLERELQQYRNILRGRGREFGPDGDLLE